MTFPRYPTYKDSGVEWLGEVPEHWGVNPFRRHLLAPLTNGIFKKKDDFGAGTLLINVFDIFRNDFLVDAKNLDRVICTVEEQLSYSVENGDLFFVRSSLKQEGIAVVAMANNPKESMVYECHLIRARPNSCSLHSRFASYLFNSALYRIQFIKSAKITTMTTIDQGAIKSIEIIIPTIAEQTKIADFLDKETAKIDALIAEQIKLVELLKEKRQRIISNAVTKGLNPKAKMKASGVEWLGEVPEGWEVKRLKYNLRLLTGKTDRRDCPIALENIEGWTGRYISTETEFQGEGVAFIAGDILFGKLRPYLAKAYVAETSGEAVGDFHVMRPNSGIDSRFAQYQILNREFIAIVDSSTFGSKMPRASWEFVAGMRVTMPPLIEQIQIVEFINSETKKIDNLIEEASKGSELLNERRSALISAAVTGKIDVRKAS